jgi:hypothetical protein
VLRDLGLTSNQVWGLTKTDQEWSETLPAGTHLNHPGRAARDLAPVVLD